MLKWIGGGCLVLVLLIAGGLYFGYRKVSNMASEEPTRTIVVGANVDRVFALLSDADSLRFWMAEGRGVSTTRRGMLKRGDTLRLDMPGQPPGRQGGVWVVGEVTPGKTFVLELRHDSTGMVMTTRSYALEQRGDSTAVSSTVMVPMLDTIRARVADSGRAASGAMSVATNLMVGMLRMQARLELDMIKARVEGRPSLQPD